MGYTSKLDANTLINMKVMHIGQMIGGLGIYIKNSIMYADRDFEYIIVCGKKDTHTPILKNGEQIKEYHVRLFRNLNLFNDLVCLFQVISIILKENPDIIHCHSAKGGFIGRFAAFLTGNRAIYTPHAFSFLSASNVFKKNLYILLEKAARLNSKMLACSESERILGMNVVGIKTCNALVWNNSVPDTFNVELPSISEKEPYIVCVGRPCYQKNTTFLVEVIAQVLKTNPNLKIYLLGVGYFSPDLLAMKNLIKYYKIEDRFVLLPWLNQNETFAYVKNALFYLSVSRYEGLPLSIIEAMSLSKAIIASDVLGNKDCVENNFNGFLLPLDSALFVSKIKELITNAQLRDVYGKNSRIKYLKEFNIKTQISKLEDVYESYVKI